MKRTILPLLLLFLAPVAHAQHPRGQPPSTPGNRNARDG